VKQTSGRTIITACFALLCCISILPTASGQTKTYERSFAQSESAMKKALQQMQSGMAGHLPTLDGFAVAGQHGLERYQRGYFQVSAQVMPAGRGCVVRVSAKVTAWYDDPQKSHSGYELLVSNGRIENDVLDQLSEQLAAANPAPEKEPERVVQPDQTKTLSQSNANVAHAKPEKVPVEAAHLEPKQPATPSEEAISAPQPHLFDSPSTVSSSLARGLASTGSTASPGAFQPETPKADPERTQLLAELDQLQEVVKNQAHPKNMAAVKKAGTAVVATPSLSAKPIFLASAHDEFEILNYNQDWVHVRISGLSRGWIWRNDLELPDSIPDTQAAPTNMAANFFHVVREETAPFPGDWEPLRGKNVKLISVQQIDESAKETGPQVKLDFAKSLLDKNSEEMAQKSTDLAGIVLIFDSADGGMIAVPASILQKWKSGKLSDSALWHASYFDPPETFSGEGSAGQ
jgi:hypothetical protein